MAIVVAFAGKIGSGKTTVTNSLAGLLCWHRASFGDYVRLVVRERRLDATREELQRVGTELLREDPRHFCSSVLLNCGWRCGENLIIDGLRHVETIEIIQKLVQPALLRIVFLSVDEETRIDRLTQRGEADATTIAPADAHSSEQQASSTLAASADLVIDANKPVDEIVREVMNWIRSQRRN